MKNRHRDIEILEGVVAAAVTLFLALLSWYRFDGATIRTANSWLLLAVLAAITRKDHKTMTIPNRFLIPLLLPIAVSFCTEPEIGILSRGVGFFVVSLPMFLMTVAIPGSFGGGDIKMAAICGLLLGTGRILLASFIGILMGGIYASWLLAAGHLKKDDHFAFGPFLSAGVFLAFVYGEFIYHWYIEFLN